LAKSKIIINLGSTTFNEKYYPWLFNTLFLVNSKPIFYDWTVTPAIIPAFENVIVEASIDYTNLFSSPLTNFAFTVWKQIGTDFASIPTNCVSQVPSSSVKVPTVSNIDTTKTLLCTPGSSTLNSQTKCMTTPGWVLFSQLNTNTPCSFSDSFKIDIQITNGNITQSKYNVWLLYPTISYNFGSYPEYLEPGPITVNAFFAALLRTDYNPDPSSFYPLAGTGIYIDNVLTLENKAETQANEVVHYAIVPLITPLMDCSDQVS